MNRLKELREKLHIQQKDFAERININKTTYNNYERGTREPDAKFWTSVATEFNVSTDYLLGLTDDFEIKKEPSVPAKTSTEDYRFQDITKCFYSMNEEGKDSLHKQAIMHYGVKEYKKDDGISSENAG